MAEETVGNKAVPYCAWVIWEREGGREEEEKEIKRYK